jgi:anti-sigma factor RsiW
MTARTCGQPGIDERALALHAGGDLDPASAARVQRHLASCLACRRVLESYRATGAWLREHEPAAPPAELLDQLQGRLQARLGRRRPAPRLLACLERGLEAWRAGWYPAGAGRTRLAATVGASALLMVGAVGAWLGGGHGPALEGARVQSAGGAANPALDTAGHGGLRIEMQTGDPNVRIIWFAAGGGPGRPGAGAP